MSASAGGKAEVGAEVAISVAFRFVVRVSRRLLEGGWDAFGTDRGDARVDAVVDGSTVHRMYLHLRIWSFIEVRRFVFIVQPLPVQ